MKQIIEGNFDVDDFYPIPMVIDPRKYKGRGRPKKSDYSPMEEVMAYYFMELNTAYLNRIDSFILK